MKENFRRLITYSVKQGRWDFSFFMKQMLMLMLMLMLSCIRPTETHPSWNLIVSRRPDLNSCQRVSCLVSRVSSHCSRSLSISRAFGTLSWCASPIITLALFIKESVRDEDVNTKALRSSSTKRGNPGMMFSFRNNSRWCRWLGKVRRYLTLVIDYILC